MHSWGSRESISSPWIRIDCKRNNGGGFQGMDLVNRVEKKMLLLRHNFHLKLSNFCHSAVASDLISFTKGCTKSEPSICFQFCMWVVHNIYIGWYSLIIYEKMELKVLLSFYPRRRYVCTRTWSRRGIIIWNSYHSCTFLIIKYFTLGS